MRNLEEKILLQTFHYHKNYQNWLVIGHQVEKIYRLI